MKTNMNDQKRFNKNSFEIKNLCQNDDSETIKKKKNTFSKT
jgi:hypothetical protein